MSPTTMKPGYSGREIADLAGITYRQLDYWARTDVIRPSLRDASGSGSRRRYSKEDLILLRIIKQMLDQGVKLEIIRAVANDMREDFEQEVIGEDSLLVISKDHGQYIVHTDAELLEIIHRGSTVSVFPIDLSIPPPRPEWCPSCQHADLVDVTCIDEWHRGPRYA